MMEPVRMMHPKHGFTHAYDHAEIEKLKGWGWDIEPIPAAKDVAPVAPIGLAGGEAPVVPLKRRGRPPRA